MKKTTLAAAALLAFASTGAAFAYDGTNCRAPGICWEPKPGFPETVEGTEFDPLHDPAEVSKQGESIKEMDERNARRVAYFMKTGEFIYDVDDIPAE